MSKDEITQIQKAINTLIDDNDTEHAIVILSNLIL